MFPRYHTSDVLKTTSPWNIKIYNIITAFCYVEGDGNMFYIQERSKIFQ
jgi:hypothetical protein